MKTQVVEQKNRTGKALWGLLFLWGITAVYFAYSIFSEHNLIKRYFGMARYGVLLGIILGIFLPLVLLTVVLRKKIIAEGFDKKQYGYGLAGSLSLTFLILVYLPAEVYFHNSGDFGFPYQLILRSYVLHILFWIIVPPLVLALLRKPVFDKIYVLLVGLLLAVYVQYMFLNRNLGALSGADYIWQEHIGETIGDLCVWVLILGGAIFFAIKKREIACKVANYIYIGFFLLHFITFGTILVQADQSCFHYGGMYFDDSERFCLGEEGNIIVYVLDSVDNRHTFNLLEENEDILKEFKDYTIYTNTCSVYDQTSTSLLQMVTNGEIPLDLRSDEYIDKAWQEPQAVAFHNRMHEAGYEIIYSGFENQQKSVYAAELVDNAKLFNEEKDSPTEVSYKRIYLCTKILVQYMAYPQILKSTVSTGDAYFKDCVIYTMPASTDLEGYNAERDLKERGGKYYVMRHTDGTHLPHDDVETFVGWLDAIAEDMNQMKDMGLYENATIIITSDHGSDYGVSHQVASTPIFWMKLGGEQHEEVVRNDAPISHEDYLATILYAAGLYEDSDEAVYGKPVNFYEEGESRVRYWHDCVYDPNYPKYVRYNTLYQYSFDGDTKEFERVVEAGENLTILPVKH